MQFRATDFMKVDLPEAFDPVKRILFFISMEFFTGLSIRGWYRFSRTISSFSINSGVVYSLRLFL